MNLDTHRFQFVRRLGSGVLGEVHEVIDEVRGESVVLKVFVRCQPAKPEHFRLEFEALARLNHDNLVQMHNLVDPASDTNVVLEERFGVPGLAFTQELIDGEDLLSFLRRNTTDDERGAIQEQQSHRTIEFIPDSRDIDPISGEVQTLSTELDPSHADESAADASSIVSELAQPDEAPPLDVVILRLQSLLPQLVSALEYLHRFHRVHGNLRPSNVMVTSDGRVKLTDYGIVPELVYSHPDADEQISLLSAPENVPFLAPEVTDTATVASDLYALGCLLFEAIAGESPFEALEFDPNNADGTHLRPPPLADHVPECPQAWGDIVDGLLRDDPDERPSLVDVLDGATRHVAKRVVVQARKIAPQRNMEGRRNVLRQLINEARRATNDTRLQLSVIEGAAGIGKTAIVQQLGHFLSRRGWLVLDTTCLHREVIPHQSWAPLAEQLGEVLSAMPDAYREQIAGPWSRASTLLPQLRGPATGLELRRRDAVRALHDLLDFVSHQRPILLILDDVENASWDSTSLLVELLSDVRKLRGMCVVTWTTDAPRASQQRLFEDLDRTLVDYQTISLNPLDPADAPKLAERTPSDLIAPGQVFPLLTHFWNAYPKQVELAVEEREPNDAHGWFERSAELIFEELKPVEQTTSLFVALSSYPTPREKLIDAVERFDAKYRSEQVSGAIETLLEIGLISETDAGAIFLSHDSVRVGLERATDQKTQNGVYNKLAAVWRDDAPFAFEYTHRAGHITTAVEAASSQAEDAKNAFATHRAAKIWRWLQESRDKLPGGSEIDPLPKLAEVEFASGEFETAAALFGEWAARGSKDSAEVYLKQAEAMLRAMDVQATRGALEQTLQGVGSFYIPTGLGHVVDAWDRLTSGFSLFNSPPLDPLPNDRLKLDQRAYRSAASWDRYVSGKGSRGAVARLVNIASKRRGATSWAVAKLEFARRLSRDRPTVNGDRLIDLANEARNALERCEDESLKRHAELFYNRCYLQFGSPTLWEVHEIIEDLQPHSGFAEVRASLDIAELSLQFGGLESASRFALEVIRANRRDALIAAKAFGILADAAMIRGDNDGCALFVQRANVDPNYESPTPFEVEWLIRNCQFSVSQNQPEVGVAQCQLMIDCQSYGSLSKVLKTELWLTLQHCANAQYNTQRRIQSPRIGDTERILEHCRRELQIALRSSAPLTAAVIWRGEALHSLRQNRYAKAEKHLQKSAELIGRKYALVEIAKMTEAFGIVREARDEGAGNEMLEQSRALNRYLNSDRPLGLEGWPVPDSWSDNP